MRRSNRTAPPAPRQRWEARDVSSMSDRMSVTSRPPPKTWQAVTVRSVLSEKTCIAENMVGRGSSPVFALCRILLAQGFDPTCALEAWRGDVLCLRVSSIGEAANLTVEETRHGNPRLRRWRMRGRGYGASSAIREKADGVVGPQGGTPT